MRGRPRFGWSRGKKKGFSSPFDLIRSTDLAESRPGGRSYKDVRVAIRMDSGEDAPPTVCGTSIALAIRSFI